MFVKTNPRNKYVPRKTNRKPRDFWGPNMCCRRSRKQMYCKCPTPVEGIHPIIDGDYIWYSLDPKYGFINSTDRDRLVNDSGSTGSFDGQMYSGISLTLGSDGYIDVPVFGQFDCVVYFDGITREFKQIMNINGLTHIRLDTGLYGPIVRLRDKHFTQYDLDVFTENPIDVIRWKFGEDVGVSINPTTEDYLYALMEGAGGTIYEVDYNSDKTRYLTLSGTYIWNKNVSYGVQTMRLETGPVNTPYDNIVNNGIDVVDYGDYIVDHETRSEDD